MNASGTPALPWYRHPWPWLLMAGPAAVIVAGLVTMVIAFRSDDGLVADDYYKRGLAINQVLSRDEQARRLGLHASASFSGMRARVLLLGASEAPPELRLRLIHPTRSGRDQLVTLRAVAPATYEGALAPLEGESRQLVLEDPKGIWRLTGTRIGGRDSATLGAAP